MTTEREFADKAVIVTGAARGIGHALVERLAELGAKVAAFDILEGAFTHPDIAAYRVDLRREGAIADAVGAFAAKHGGIDLLVNNAAAITQAKPVPELTLDEWRTAFDVNVTATFLTARHAVPHMRGRKGAAIVNVASQLGHVAAFGKAAYSASKAALIAFSRSLAVDLAPDGIRVNSISPGPVWTERMAPNYADRAAAEVRLGDGNLLGRVASADEIVEAILFLGGGRAAYMTGSDLVIDGGYLAR